MPVLFLILVFEFRAGRLEFFPSEGAGLIERLYSLLVVVALFVAESVALSDTYRPERRFDGLIVGGALWMAGAAVVIPVMRSVLMPGQRLRLRLIFFIWLLITLGFIVGVRTR
jgi:hypothetical protein